MTNRIHLLCGITMIISLAGLFVSLFFIQQMALQYHLVFWLETLIFESFGFSWIVKSGWVLFKYDDGYKLYS
jgi:hypothetical protein